MAQNVGVRIINRQIEPELDLFLMKQADMLIEQEPRKAGWNIGQANGRIAAELRLDPPQCIKHNVPARLIGQCLDVNSEADNDTPAAAHNPRKAFMPISMVTKSSAT